MTTSPYNGALHPRRRCATSGTSTVLLAAAAFVFTAWMLAHDHSPVVSVSTRYPGAAAEVVETQITDPLEEQLSAIDGVRLMRSDSAEERSNITLEFNLDRDVDSAANDVRDRVGRAIDRLPDEVDPPEVSKADADDDPVVVLSFNSPRMSRLELTELATLATDIQTSLDNAESGLSPLGVTENGIAFDLNPNAVTGTEGGSHFEQISARYFRWQRSRIPSRASAKS